MSTNTSRDQISGLSEQDHSTIRTWLEISCYPLEMDQTSWSILKFADSFNRRMFIFPEDSPLGMEFKQQSNGNLGPFVYHTWSSESPVNVIFFRSAFSETKKWITFVSGEHQPIEDLLSIAVPRICNKDVYGGKFEIPNDQVVPLLRQVFRDCAFIELVIDL